MFHRSSVERGAVHVSVAYLYCLFRGRGIREFNVGESPLHIENGLHVLGV